MSIETIFYPESKYGGFPDIDGTIIFYTRVKSLVNEQSTVLDFGCGRGAYGNDKIPIRRELQIFKGKVKKVIGIDIDKEAENNPYLNEFHLVDNEQWPLKDNSIDLCVCDSVLEHIEKPGTFFAEASRVLRDKGYLCIRTANKWAYVSVISKIIPNRLHVKVLNKVQDERRKEDVFPTFYKCNSIFKIRRMLKKSGFEHVVYGYEAQPCYLSFSKIVYSLGVILFA